MGRILVKVNLNLNKVFTPAPAAGKLLINHQRTHDCDVT